FPPHAYRYTAYARTHGMFSYRIMHSWNVLVPYHAQDGVRVSNVDDVPQYCSQAWVTHLNMFATNETRLNANMTPILDRLHAVAARCNTFSYIIETHADQRADAQYNKLLTEGRARSIKDYLLSLGMAHHRILMNPMGESAPIATGTSASDHAKNRRIVIKPIRQQDLASASLDLH
ncbi:MAG: OmpA family protein, partial [Pseudomonadota bacterium]